MKLHTATQQVRTQNHYGPNKVTDIKLQLQKNLPDGFQTVSPAPECLYFSSSFNCFLARFPCLRRARLQP